MTTNPSFPERLVTARKLVAAIPDKDAAIAKHGVAAYDQALASAHHAVVDMSLAGVLWGQVYPELNVVVTDESWDDRHEERAAMLLAALLGCTPCSHLVRTTAQGTTAALDKVVFVNLNQAVALCRICVKGHSPVAGFLDDDRCEVCGQPSPDGVFMQFAIALFGARYAGNAGSCCAPTLLKPGGTNTKENR